MSILAEIKEGGASRWELSADGKEVKDFPFASLWFCVAWALLHGYGFPEIRRDAG